MAAALLRPILYQDVDDTILGRRGQPAVATPVLLRWAMRHFEVRWLTMWAPSGTVAPDLEASLAMALGLEIAEVRAMANPHPFPVVPVRFARLTEFESWRDKSKSVRAMLAETPEREWVWVEDDDLLAPERAFVAQHPTRYFCTDSYRDPRALLNTYQELARRFRLPDPLAP